MTDQSILASCATLCGLTCFSALEPWCNTRRYGCDCCGCGGQRGFCNSCFDRGFNEDSWDNPESDQQPSKATAPAPDSANHNADSDNAAPSPDGQPQTDANTEKVIQSQQPEAMPEMKPSNDSAQMEWTTVLSALYLLITRIASSRHRVCSIFFLVLFSVSLLFVSWTLNSEKKLPLSCYQSHIYTPYVVTDFLSSYGLP